MRLDTVSVEKSLKGPEKNQGSQGVVMGRHRADQEQVGVTGRQTDIVCSRDHIWLLSTKEGWEGGRVARGAGHQRGRYLQGTPWRTLDQPLRSPVGLT